MIMEDIILASKAFGMVMVGMIVITAFLYLLRYLAERTNGAAQEPALPVSQASEPGEDPELIAVLAAAAYTALGVPVRIHRVRMLERPSADNWARAGRMDVMYSHRVGPKS